VHRARARARGLRRRARSGRRGGGGPGAPTSVRGRRRVSGGAAECQGGESREALRHGRREGGGRGWGGGVGAGEVGEDGLHGEGVLDGGDDAQPAATAGTGEAVEVDHAAHQGSPGPRARGVGGAGAGFELARGGVRGRAAVADTL
jgi:hypothetical protein